MLDVETWNDLNKDENPGYLLCIVCVYPIVVLPQDDKSRSKPCYSLLVGLGYTQCIVDYTTQLHAWFWPPITQSVFHGMSGFNVAVAFFPEDRLSWVAQPNERGYRHCYPRSFRVRVTQVPSVVGKSPDCWEGWIFHWITMGRVNNI